MKTMHITLSGKGGTGKSTVTYTYINYIIELLKENNPNTEYYDLLNEIYGFDCDIVNGDFSKFENTKNLNIANLGSEKVNNWKKEIFENMFIRRICNDDSLQNKTILVDVGSNTYSDTIDVLFDHGAIVDILEQTNFVICMHLVISGAINSNNYAASIGTFDKIMNSIKELKTDIEQDTLVNNKDLFTRLKILLWINNYPERMVTSNGLPITEGKTCTTHKNELSGYINLPPLESSYAKLQNVGKLVFEANEVFNNNSAKRREVLKQKIRLNDLLSPVLGNFLREIDKETFGKIDLNK